MENNNIPDSKYAKLAGLVIGILAFVVAIVKFIPGNDNITLNDIASEQVAINDVDGAQDNGLVQDTQTIELDEATEEAEKVEEAAEYVDFFFRNDNLLNSHFEKHGKDMGFDNATAYEKAASDVVNNKEALHKVEAEDGDDVYYLESTNEFVVVSTDGYIRTYFQPDDGIEYFNRQ